MNLILLKKNKKIDNNNKIEKKDRKYLFKCSISYNNINFF